LIEWPSRLSQHPQLLPNPMQLLEIDISIRSASDERVMTLKALTGSSWAGRLQTLVTEGMVDDLMVVEPQGDAARVRTINMKLLGVVRHSQTCWESIQSHSIARFLLLFLIIMTMPVQHGSFLYVRLATQSCLFANEQ
jgi:hypothetical protein